MLTYSDLFQFCLVIIGIISLVVQIINHKRK
ncbi:putative holin-like toxin [Colidextribacter sp. OB.20]